MRLNHHTINMILVIIVIGLACICFISIYKPIRFSNEQTQRESVIKKKLLKIRYAEEKYKRIYGNYAGNFKQLTNCKLISDSMKYIPFSDGEIFELQATTTISKSGRTVPMMECSARYDQYLNGLDDNSISNLNDEAAKAGRYPGLKIGDILTPNNNAGNWE